MPFKMYLKSFLKNATDKIWKVLQALFQKYYKHYLENATVITS
jgi:hypothetical protein